MLKYKEVEVTFSEVPEEVTLCINITGCPIHCKGCHSPHLWKDEGEELKPVVLSNLIAKNKGITCVAFMGGDSSPLEIMELAKWVKNNTELKTCWYSGRDIKEILPAKFDNLDYIKFGPYIVEKGGLNNPNTNQRFCKIRHEIENNECINLLDDITFKFRKHETEN